MRSKRTKATDIPKRVKEIVWERDNHRCVVCGNSQNVMPNAHYISRADGGLGIEQNIVTLCTSLTENKCHYNFDEGDIKEQERIGKKIKQYLIGKYPNWENVKLIYDRWG